jgi:NAD(P)-dependent dehydrogenase (short-subunit alcohol dehydrogenase family)
MTTAEASPGTTTAPRRILISGGSSGIGYACARHLAERGDRVWVLGSSEASVTTTLNGIAPLAGGTACDVSDAEAVRAAFAAATDELGGLDGVFANAGIDGLAVPAADLDVSHFRRVLEVNVIGAFLVAQAGLKTLTRPGAIVLNASVNAIRPERLFLDYNASKAAVVSMAKTLALEESARGVAVTALCPGYFPTRMTAGYLADEATRRDILHGIPAARTGELDEIAKVVDFLLSPAAAYLTGSVISLDGGASI